MRIATIACCVYVVGAFAVTRASQARAAGEPASSPAEMLADAELHDVLFLDPDRGWAVGDRGVIWQTESGGRSWHLIDSPTTARLRSIYFADEQHGWIAGGWLHPGTLRSSAVLLRTDNGGRKWVGVDASLLPALRQVHFTDSRNGWALGSSSPLYGSGCFRSSDGGDTWDSLPDTPPLSVSMGSIFDSRRAFLVAADSSAWSYTNGAVTRSVRAGDRESHPRSVRFSGARGWMAGDKGLVQHSVDGGEHWNSPPGKLPAGVRGAFDWRAVAIRGNQCWIAGAPGTCVLHSPDSGRSWRMLKTGQIPPINQIYFLDEQHGWAVGPMGRILATRDGGQSWRVQHSAGERAGLLAIHARDELVPLELLAKVAADDGYLAAAVVLHSRREVANATATWEDRLRDACSAVGTTTAEYLSLAPQLPDRESPEPSTGLVPESGSRLASAANPLHGPPNGDLEELLVRHLRMWRPDVVLTDNLSAPKGQPWSALAGPAVLAAVQRASDPAVFPDQIVVSGLQPWTVRKVLGVVYPPESASVVVDTNRLSMQLGCSLAEYTVPGRGVLPGSVAAASSSVGCRLLWSQATQQVATREIFSGIPTTPSGETRRSVSSPPPSRIESLSRSAQLLRKLQAMAAAGVDGNSDPAAVLSQVEQLLRDQEPSAAGRLLYRLAQLFISAGQYSAADACLKELDRRFPDHPMNDAAALWLLDYHGSAEIQRAFGTRRPTRLPAVADTNAATASERGIPLATNNTPLPQAADSEHLLQAVRTSESIRQRKPALSADPRVQFPLVSAQRRLGNTAEAVRLLNVLTSGQLPCGWRTAARSELNLLDRPVRLASAFDANPPAGGAEPSNGAAVTKPGNAIAFLPTPRMVVARRAATKPYLDGKLDDDCWNSANWMRCPSTESDPTTEFQFAHDEDFLYVAVSCSRAPEQVAVSRPKPQVRDASLFGQDRIEVDLDLDRDYHTYFRFAVSPLGGKYDACGEAARWNPQWFVAIDNGPTWALEVAIPRSELTDAVPSRGETWCVRVRRVLPEVERPFAMDDPSTGFIRLTLSND